MVAPKDLDEALSLLSREAGTLTPFAGGTDLMVSLEAGKLPAGRFLSLHTVRELRGISVSDEAIVIGAATTYSDISRHPVISAEFPNLVHAAMLTGAIAIQNRGTLGGNIANASPAADSPPALLAYGADIELVSARGRRRLAYDGFHTGYKTSLRQPDELISAIIIPRSKGRVFHAYHKVGTRRAQAISKVVMAISAGFDGDRCNLVRMAFGSVGPVTLRAHNAEGILNGQVWNRGTISQAVEAAGRAISPIDDIRSNATYRRTVAKNILRTCLETWAQEAK
jgi:CO/xanthine dehydrogenase FAD-binding subunit